MSEGERQDVMDRIGLNVKVSMDHIFLYGLYGFSGSYGPAGKMWLVYHGKWVSNIDFHDGISLVGGTKVFL